MKIDYERRIFLNKPLPYIVYYKSNHTVPTFISKTSHQSVQKEEGMYCLYTRMMIKMADGVQPPCEPKQKKKTSNSV